MRFDSEIQTKQYSFPPSAPFLLNQLIIHKSRYAQPFLETIPFDGYFDNYNFEQIFNSTCSFI